MVEKLGIEDEKIPELCNLLYKNYGTTMARIRAIGYDFHYDKYHSFVHGGLSYENLKPDSVLRTLLLSFPIRKVDGAQSHGLDTKSHNPFNLPNDADLESSNIVVHDED
ncbi:hypothetical protein L6452_22563 [Arctium lappa]|uniref:Uncharacterized protein n=1 Tax=Arctium lappa TaxID=4217 RepID=A0ACB9AZJ1_ARCLA|nr:hypothetical protein L6452_22563 [Arctium lappa]